MSAISLQTSTQAPRDGLIHWLKTGILLGLAAYFVYNIVSGNIANYINARFAWLSYVAVVLFLLLGIYYLINGLRGNVENRNHDGKVGMSLGALSIVAIPLLLGTLIPSRPLGADAIDGNVSTSAALGSMTTFTLNPLDRNVLDWLRYFASLDNYAVANGERADLIGFVYREPTFGDDQFMVARFTVSCCVADASAIGVPIQWSDTAELPLDQWVRVQGVFQVGDFRDDTLPILHAESIEVVEQPPHPYLYP